MIETLLHKFYDASISIDPDGSMLVASTDERVLMWAALFCLITVLSVIVRVAWRNRLPGRLASAMLAATLVLTTLFLPSLIHEYIHASRHAITIETGSWYRPSRTVIGMEDINDIRESAPAGILPANLMGDPAIDWYLTRMNGDREVIDLNAFFSAHRMVVAYYYKDRGYRLERLEDRSR